MIFPLGQGELTWRTGKPVHIAHGWSAVVPGSTVIIAKGGLRLVIDGQEIDEDFVEFMKSRETLDEMGEITIVTKFFVYNFPDGNSQTRWRS